MFDWYWYSAKKTDPRVVALFARHYSSAKNRRCINDWLHRGIAAPGESMTLLTSGGDALFQWLKSRYRQDGQDGIECSVFRNEGAVLSSELILEAEQLAIRKWGLPLRFFTFVDASAIQSRNPGYCFQCAGWERAGQSSTGLLLLEKVVA